MANLTIRNFDAALMSRLRQRAAQHGRSTEEEAQEILQAGLQPNFAEALRRHIKPVGGVELCLPSREPVRPALKFLKGSYLALAFFRNAKSDAARNWLH